MKTRSGYIARRRSIAAAALIALASVSCGGPGPEGSGDASKPGSSRIGVSEVALPPDDKLVAGQTVYAPIYPHVYTADNAEPLNLAATLYIRNTDPARPIIVSKVSFYHSGGTSLREYLTKPVQIGPLASIDFFVKESDLSGGPSPSFIVRWVATEAPSEPIIESVMIGTSGTQGISFTAAGRVIESRKLP